MTPSIRRSIAFRIHGVVAFIAAAQVIALCAVGVLLAGAGLSGGAVAIIAASLVALSGLAAILLQITVARPIQNLATAALRNFNTDNSTQGESYDQLSLLARVVDAARDHARRDGEIAARLSNESAAQDTRQHRVATELSSFTAVFQNNIDALGALSERMLEQARRLTESADGAARRTSSATLAATEASGNVRDIAAAADELAASVMEIDRQVAQSTAITEEAVAEAGRTNTAVLELSEAARRIGDVVNLITDIAEQTNLLALNATIEAARAGEAGRGFAVVAGEVKALSGQTAKATEEIARQISDMQLATRRSIEAIEAIESTIRGIGEISAAIAAAVTEQGAATQEIARSVEVAARRTTDTADEINRVGGATDNTRAGVQSVRAVAQELGDMATRMKSEIETLASRLRAA